MADLEGPNPRQIRSAERAAEQSTDPALPSVDRDAALEDHKTSMLGGAMPILDVHVDLTAGSITSYDRGGASYSIADAAYAAKFRDIGEKIRLGHKLPDHLMGELVALQKGDIGWHAFYNGAHGLIETAVDEASKRRIEAVVEQFRFEQLRESMGARAAAHSFMPGELAKALSTGNVAEFARLTEGIDPKYQAQLQEQFLKAQVDHSALKVLEAMLDKRLVKPIDTNLGRVLPQLPASAYTEEQKVLLTKFLEKAAAKKDLSPEEKQTINETKQTLEKGELRILSAKNRNTLLEILAKNPGFSDQEQIRALLNINEADLLIRSGITVPRAPARQIVSGLLNIGGKLTKGLVNLTGGVAEAVAGLFGEDLNTDVVTENAGGVATAATQGLDNIIDQTVENTVGNRNEELKVIVEDLLQAQQAYEAAREDYLKLIEDKKTTAVGIQTFTAEEVDALETDLKARMEALSKEHKEAKESDQHEIKRKITKIEQLLAPAEAEFGVLPTGDIANLRLLLQTRADLAKDPDNQELLTRADKIQTRLASGDLADSKVLEELGLAATNLIPITTQTYRNLKSTRDEYTDARQKLEKSVSESTRESLEARLEAQIVHSLELSLRPDPNALDQAKAAFEKISGTEFYRDAVTTLAQSLIDQTLSENLGFLDKAQVEAAERLKHHALVPFLDQGILGNLEKKLIVDYSNRIDSDIDKLQTAISISQTEGILKQAYDKVQPELSGRSDAERTLITAQVAEYIANPGTIPERHPLRIVFFPDPKNPDQVEIADKFKRKLDLVSGITYRQLAHNLCRTSLEVARDANGKIVLDESSGNSPANVDAFSQVKMWIGINFQDLETLQLNEKVTQSFRDLSAIRTDGLAVIAALEMSPEIDVSYGTHLLLSVLQKDAKSNNRTFDLTNDQGEQALAKVLAHISLESIQGSPEQDLAVVRAAIEKFGSMQAQQSADQTATQARVDRLLSLVDMRIETKGAVLTAIDSLAESSLDPETGKTNIDLNSAYDKISENPLALDQIAYDLSLSREELVKIYDLHILANGGSTFNQIVQEKIAGITTAHDQTAEEKYRELGSLNIQLVGLEDENRASELNIRKEALIREIALNEIERDKQLAPYNQLLQVSASIVAEDLHKSLEQLKNSEKTTDEVKELLKKKISTAGEQGLTLNLLSKVYKEKYGIELETEIIASFESSDGNAAAEIIHLATNNLSISDLEKTRKAFEEINFSNPNSLRSFLNSMSELSPKSQIALLRADGLIHGDQGIAAQAQENINALTEKIALEKDEETLIKLQTERRNWLQIEAITAGFNSERALDAIYRSLNPAHQQEIRTFQSFIMWTAEYSGLEAFMDGGQAISTHYKKFRMEAETRLNNAYGDNWEGYKQDIKERLTGNLAAALFAREITGDPSFDEDIELRMSLLFRGPMNRDEESILIDSADEYYKPMYTTDFSQLHSVIFNQALNIVINKHPDSFLRELEEEHSEILDSNDFSPGTAASYREALLRGIRAEFSPLLDAANYDHANWRSTLENIYGSDAYTMVSKISKIMSREIPIDDQSLFSKLESYIAQTSPAELRMGNNAALFISHVSLEERLARTFKNSSPELATRIAEIFRARLNDAEITPSGATIIEAPAGK